MEPGKIYQAKWDVFLTDGPNVYPNRGYSADNYIQGTPSTFLVVEVREPQFSPGHGAGPVGSQWIKALAPNGLGWFTLPCSLVDEIRKTGTHTSKTYITFWEVVKTP